MLQLTQLDLSITLEAAVLSRHLGARRQTNSSQQHQPGYLRQDATLSTPCLMTLVSITHRQLDIVMLSFS
jgi:hypothetical protein